MSKKESTQNKIYKSAIALFKSEGYRNTTMRKIANNSGVALGSTYYYYKSKKDIVLKYYLLKQQEVKLLSEHVILSNKKFALKLKIIYNLQINLLKEDNKFILILLSGFSDADNQLNPLSSYTYEIREVNINIFKRLVATTSIKEKTKEVLPHLLWLLQMAIIYYWLFDKSKGYSNTKKLIDNCIDLIAKFINLSKLPGFGGITATLLNIIKLVLPN